MKAGWGRVLSVGAATLFGAAGAAVAWGRWAVPDSLPLPAAVPGEQRTTSRRAGPLSYYVAGSGAPVLLIHSINAAASAYEVGPLFEALRGSRRVFAVDLPGFGASDRSARPYGIPLYVDAIHDMLDEIRDETGAGPVDALALSLAGEFLGRAAAERPDAFRTLTLVTPTGFERGAGGRRGPPGGTREMAGLSAFLDVPLWNRGLYNLLVTRPSIRFFLEKTWGSRRIDEGAWNYAYLTSHQPGAWRAPLAFVSGRLFAADIRTVYGELRMPVLMLHGTRGDFQDFTDSGWTASRPNWRVVPLDTGALPQFERLGDVMRELEPFLSKAATASPQASSSSSSRLPRP